MSNTQKTANNTQIGGTHYKKRGYQHWDWCIDCDINFMIGNCAKYMARHLHKNGKSDLEKAKHYLLKIEEREIKLPVYTNIVTLTDKYLRQYAYDEQTMIRLLLLGRFEELYNLISRLISRYDTANRAR